MHIILAATHLWSTCTKAFSCVLFKNNKKPFDCYRIQIYPHDTEKKYFLLWILLYCVRNVCSEKYKNTFWLDDGNRDFQIHYNCVHTCSFIYANLLAVFNLLPFFSLSISFSSFCSHTIYFFHFQPAGIIKCVTLTTMYINSMWWPPNRSVGGMINQMIFLILSALSVFNYVMGTICGPGFLPLKWEPKVSMNTSKMVTNTSYGIYV